MTLASMRTIIDIHFIFRHGCELLDEVQNTDVRCAKLDTCCLRNGFTESSGFKLTDNLNYADNAVR